MIKTAYIIAKLDFISIINSSAMSGYREKPIEPKTFIKKIELFLEA